MNITDDPRRLTRRGFLPNSAGFAKENANFP
jgi:hypothetical protein